MSDAHRLALLFSDGSMNVYEPETKLDAVKEDARNHDRNETDPRLMTKVARVKLEVIEVLSDPATPRVNTGEGILWCCHVRGPDDVYPAPDYATALAWADMTNDLSDRECRKVNWDENMPRLKAVPAPWPWDAKIHAEGLAEAIRQMTPRNQLETRP